MPYVEKTVGEELDRKFLDGCMQLHDRLTSNNITKGEFIVAMESIFTIASGLVTQESAELHQDLLTETLEKGNRND